MQICTGNYHSNENAVIKLQKLWRGYQVRRNFIPRTLFHVAKEYIDRCSNIDELPRASHGITKVFLPTHLPLVFKALGIEKSKNRFLTMWKVRDLCLKNGYKNLLIPKAHPYGGYNIEEKFPVHDVNQREQVAMYEENSELFSQAVREFTGFLCQCVFPDILAYSHPYQHEDVIPLVRCDNLPLLSAGKIALIDLGGLKIRPEKLSLLDALECAKTAIFIFPYHFDAICEVVASFCPEIEDKYTELKEICFRTQTQFKSIYRDHSQFLREKSPFQQTSEEVIRKVQTVIEKKHSLNTEIIKILTDTIVRPIAEKLTEKDTKDQSHISYVSSRSITIPCQALFDSLKLDFVHFLALPSERSFLQLNEFLGRGKNPLPSKFITLQFASLARARPKNVQSRVKSIKISEILQTILGKLIEDKDICYANQYYNRFKQPVIRVHY